MEDVHENCGVIGAIFKEENVFSSIFYGMQGLQHRGELGCGMAVNDKGKITAYKNKGLVSDVFNSKVLSQALKGTAGIGHTRYATSSTNECNEKEEIKKLHPLIGRLGDSLEFAIAFNGNLTNYNSLKKGLKNYEFETSTDTEVIKNLLVDEYKKTKSLESALKNSYSLMNGAYNIILADNSGSLYFLKDGHGFKPASIGTLKDGYIIASETRAFDFVGAKFLRDINAGELITINKDLKLNNAQLPIKRKSLCVFEYVYFASIDSVIEGITVNDVRVRLGKQLLKEQPLNIKEEEREDWTVIGVPDSGMSAATAYSNKSGIKIRIGLVRNRYYQKRTFTNGKEKERKEAATQNSEKYNVIKGSVEGKNIILIDDSIVRGNTTKNNVKRIKDYGAKSVHVKSSFPLILSPCYMGIDFPTHKELVAHKANPDLYDKTRCFCEAPNAYNFFQLKDYDKAIENIRKEIGADSVQFMSIEGLIWAVRKNDCTTGNGASGLCLACTNFDYSCDIEDEMRQH